jgi:hypothetical protein
VDSSSDCCCGRYSEKDATFRSKSYDGGRGNEERNKAVDPLMVLWVESVAKLWRDAKIDTTKVVLSKKRFCLSLFDDSKAFWKSHQKILLPRLFHSS